MLSELNMREENENVSNLISHIYSTRNIMREENKKINNLISHIYSTRNILTEINGQNEISYETTPGNIKDFKLNKINIEF